MRQFWITGNVLVHMCKQWVHVWLKVLCSWCCKGAAIDCIETKGVAIVIEAQLRSLYTLPKVTITI